MPKGVQNSNPERLEKLRAKLAQSLSFSLNTNKNYDLLSRVIFERTAAMLSSSTLRRVFQYDSDNLPTKSSLDLICKSIGFRDWDDFIEKECNPSQFDLSQVIAMYKLQGLGDHGQTRKNLEKYSEHPNFFNLLDAIVQIAILKRDIEFLGKLFELEGVFDRSHADISLIYFIHNLVIGLNQSGLMPELVGYYGANPNAQICLVEWFVDEDNLNGYYYDLLQVYHEHKTTPEAQLFYACLMYQHAFENKMPVIRWLDFLRQFNDSVHVHHIPKGRMYVILMLEAFESPDIRTEFLNKTRDLFYDLTEIEKITTALYMVKLLFFKQEDELIDKVLALVPDISDVDKNIDDSININQIKIYRAYSLYQKSEKENALLKLNEFDPLLVQAFIYNHIMDDYKVISGLIRNV